MAPPAVAADAETEGGEQPAPHEDATQREMLSNNTPADGDKGGRKKKKK